MWLSIIRDKFESSGTSVSSVITFPIWERPITLESCAQTGHPANTSVKEHWLSQTACRIAEWKLFLLLVIATMVNEGGFYGYMGTVNGTQTLGKFHFLWKPFMIRSKSIPLCSLLVMCILELTRSFIASLTFMHAVEAPIPNLSPISP